MTKPEQGTELEQSIFGLLEQSGLGPKPEQERQNLLDDDDEAQTLSRKALWQEKRRERELKSVRLSHCLPLEWAMLIRHRGKMPGRSA